MNAVLNQSENDSVRVGVILVGAGKSVRMGGMDKIFAPVAGRPVIEHSLEVFQASRWISRVVLVLSESNYGRGDALMNARNFEKVASVHVGGDRRQDSVRVGLDALLNHSSTGPFDFIMVHDAARPFVNESMIDRGVKAAQRFGAAVAAIRVSDTIKVVDDSLTVSSTQDRNLLWIAQTPQIFDTHQLVAAHRDVVRDVTDDAEMLESSGKSVAIFDGSSTNIKITTPGDLTVAEAIAVSRHGPRSGDGDGEARWGIGFDGHALVSNRPLILGGVEVPFDSGLLGHSDGDVLLHAIADALLGGSGCGDIGTHFPSSDPALKGIDSRDIVKSVIDRVGLNHWEPYYVDATIIAQRPRLSPVLSQIMESVASILGLPVTAVNVKATSTDRVGAIGGGHGIAAYAIVTLHRFQ